METSRAVDSKTGLPTSGKIFFAAFNPKTQLPVVCRPGNDKTGLLYTGQGERGYFENLTEADKEKLYKLGIPVIDHETSVIIEDASFLDMDNPIDRANAVWLLGVPGHNGHPYIAVDKGKRGKDAVFYMVNPAKDAAVYVDRTEKIDEARPAVRKLSMADQVRVATALGLNGAHTFAPAQLLEWLLKECNTRPAAVLDAVNPDNRAKVNATIFFKEIESYKIIERMRTGAYHLGGEKGISVGHNEEAVVKYLLDPANKEHVKIMKTSLAERKGTKVETDVEEVTA